LSLFLLLTAQQNEIHLGLEPIDLLQVTPACILPPKEAPQERVAIFGLDTSLKGSALAIVWMEPSHYSSSVLRSRTTDLAWQAARMTTA
jgi:hypothetical protein